MEKLCINIPVAQIVVHGYYFRFPLNDQMYPFKSLVIVYKDIIAFIMWIELLKRIACVIWGAIVHMGTLSPTPFLHFSVKHSLSSIIKKKS